MNRGTILALSAYIFWGLHPIYWKLLQQVPSTEIVSHRILWSFIFFLIIILIRREWGGLILKVKGNTNKYILFLPAFLIGSNWAMYIWAVNAGFIIETSLGYFISPLLSVFLGVFFLSESLRKIQWLAILIAGFGVLTITFFYGQFPWISIFLAVTWATYGLLRKKSPLNSVEGLLIETATLLIPVIIYLFYLSNSGVASFNNNLSTSILLVGTGIISGFPLIIFIMSARMIDLSLIGILQYIYPTLIFLIGFFVYNEPLSKPKLIGFIFIWMALLIYTTESTIYLKRKRIVTKSN
jgi:chloramphenicol-sensitive protein RarD